MYNVPNVNDKLNEKLTQQQIFGDELQQNSEHARGTVLISYNAKNRCWCHPFQ